MRPLLARACLLFLACAFLRPALGQQHLTLVAITNSWRYNLAGVDLTGQFQQTGYTDSSWPYGPALLGYDTSLPFPYPDPLLTEFPFGSSYRNTLYFRTHFDFPSNTTAVILRATNYVDDGAVFYLNASEVARLRLPAGTVTYNTRAAISNPEGQGNVLQFAATNLVQGDNVLAVEVHQNTANDLDVIFGMTLIALLPEPGPVRITNQPPSRTIEEGDSTSFVAEITGTPPYYFQWFKGGALMEAATNNSLTLTFVNLAAAGEYSFSVSNALDSVLSSNATLTITPSPFLFISMTNSWRYHAGGVNLGTTWRSATFSDNTWPQGNGVFYGFAGPLPAPKGTLLPLTNDSGQSITTWYFRTRFNWSGPVNGAVLRARTLIDDGAVFYVNGAEAGRLGMAAPPTAIAYNTTATYRIDAITNHTTVALAATNLVQGENVFAVEVHQTAAEASDVVFGLALGTNFALSLPDLVFWGPASTNIEARSFNADPCEIQETCGTAETHRILRFATETRNIGEADLIMGAPENNPLFVYDECHGHYHFEHFAEYRLRDMTGASVVVATGNKVGFCLLDHTAWDPNASPTYLYECEYQGIQRGWSDIYFAGLPCQWIDITGLPGGDYILELEIDPLNRIAESNESNNITQVVITIPDCPPPPNDQFNAAAVVTEPISTYAADTACATRESYEPDHAGRMGFASVWYRWTAPGSGILVVDTRGSGFDTLLAAYSGTNLSDLTSIASNDDYDPYYTSRIAFDVVAGTRYSIAVDGYCGATGNVIVNFNYRPMIPPTFLTPEFLAPQQLRLTIRGGAADWYMLETSADFAAWVPWRRFTNRTGMLQVIDSPVPLSRRFYRARLMP